GLTPNVHVAQRFGEPQGELALLALLALLDKGADATHDLGVRRRACRRHLPRRGKTRDRHRVEFGLQPALERVELLARRNRGHLRIRARRRCRNGYRAGDRAWLAEARV